MNAQNTLQTYDLLKPVAEAVNRAITIESIDVVTADSVWQINTCNTLWASPGFPVEINGQQYEITDLDPNVSITVTSKGHTIAPPTDPFLLYPFFFVHGTLRSVKDDLNEEKFFYNKYPLLWLHDVGQENFDRDIKNVLGRTSPVNMYALISTTEKKYNTLDHDRYAIKPARNLMNAFLDALIASKITTMNLGTDRSWFSHSMRDHARFGAYYNSGGVNSGHSAKLIEDDVSGTHLQFDIPFKKPQHCNPCAAYAPIGGVKIFIDGVYSHTQPANTEYNFVTPTP